MEIVFATNNQKKLKEIKQILEPIGVKVNSLSDLNIDVDIEETGETFEENALIKARAIHELTGKTVLADDSGLEVFYLDNAPGVYSARFLGEDTEYTVKNQYIIDKLESANEDERGARFVTVIACVYRGGEEFVVRGEVNGVIAKEQQGVNGFGYDPIFFVESIGKTFANMSDDEKNSISHRGIALRLAKDKLVDKLV